MDCDIITIAIGCDHAGYTLKSALAAALERAGHAVLNMGCDDAGRVDYPEYAHAVCRAVAGGLARFGVLVCGSGVGMSIAANRHPEIRCALANEATTARLSREHNDANVIALGGRLIGEVAALDIVRTFLATPYEGGRHEQRLRKLTPGDGAMNGPQRFFTAPLSETDPELAAAIGHELRRQQDCIELIASENIVSQAVLEAQGSVLTNKYAEGYPGRRYYGGCEFVDVAERLAIDRAKQLFSCEFANVQPHSGAQANQAAFLALLKPGDTILGMSLAAGGHLTHGAAPNLSGKWFRAVQYGVRRDDGLLDYEDMERLARTEKPRMIIAGGSAYPRVIDFPRFRKIADEVGAYFLVDMAHFAGLVAADLFPSPVPHAHLVTTTTHKTLRGPRGGMVLSNDAEIGKKINSAVFPGLQGGPLMHVIAAKAAAFGEALRPEFRTYQRAVFDNARALAATLVEQGLAIVTGGTDSHLMLVDLRPKHVTGKSAEGSLDRAHITANKNAIPFDPEKPAVTSGVRLGTPAATTRGFGVAEFQEVGRMIGEVLDGLGKSNDGTNEAVEQAVGRQVLELCARFPIYAGSR